MADGYGFGRPVRDEDFEEEDVWAVIREREGSSPESRKGKDYSLSSSSSSSARGIPSSSRKIPKSNEGDGRVFQQSAPVNIPDWSQIDRKKASSSERHMNGDDDDDVGIEISDGDDDGEDRVPPHEWIVKKLARSQIASFSVCEGAGRTLKGRDLSKVRNAVLSRTGFLERSSSSSSSSS